MRAAGTAALGAALALAGAGFGSPSLVVPGLALLALAGGAALWVESAAAGARLEREPGPERIAEGDAYPLALRLRRGLVPPPPGGELRDPLLAGPVRVGPRRPRRVTREVTMPRRGRWALTGAEWEIRDPIGLRSRLVRARGGGELLVLPRVHPVRAPGGAGDAAAGGQARAGEDAGTSVREAQAVEFEIDGLRPYRSGSPASRIHWPAVARSGEMHERRPVAGADAVPLVVLDAAEPASEEALDRAVRAAASLCVHLAPGRGCAIQVPGTRAPLVVDPRLRAWPQVHERLALVGAGAPSAAPSRGAARGSVLWVTAGSQARARRVLRGLGSGPHWIVSATGGEGRAAFEVAGCRAVAVGAHARRLAA